VLQTHSKKLGATPPTTLGTQSMPLTEAPLTPTGSHSASHTLSPPTTTAGSIKEMEEEGERQTKDPVHNVCSMYWYVLELLLNVLVCLRTTAQ